MGIFRRENDGRRVVRFPDRATAQETIRLIATAQGSPKEDGTTSPALTAAPKGTKKERATFRSKIKTIQKDAQTLSEMDPKRFDAGPRDSGEETRRGPWRDPRPNREATLEADAWPSSGSHTGKPGMTEYGDEAKARVEAEKANAEKTKLWD